MSDTSNLFNYYNADLKPLAPGTSTHPYNHAAKLFIADNLRLAPKASYLYYVVITIDPSQTGYGGGLLGTALSLADRYQSFENGLLVKRAELPKFEIASQVFNAYNRKSVVNTKIDYDPVTLTFHDDSADVITNFWNDYYTYYYRDSDYDSSAYRTEYKYTPRTNVNWGYTPQNGGLNSLNSQVPTFIQDIRIFSLHNKRFTEYRLMNPSITSWRHGEHDSYQGTGTLECTMTVRYETVKYFTGYVNPVDVLGFSLLHYDTEPSPISRSLTNIYSDAGILGAINGATKDLSKPYGSTNNGSLVSNILNVYRSYNNLKNINLKTVVGTTLGSIGAGILNKTLNGGLPYAFPNLGSGLTSQNSTQTSVGYISPFTDLAPEPASTVAQNPYPASETASTVTDPGIPVALVSGAAITQSKQAVLDQSAKVNRGITTPTNSGLPPSFGSSKVYDIKSTNGDIVVDIKTLSTITGTVTEYTYDATGQLVSATQASGVQNGSFTANNTTLNIAVTQTVRDPEGNTYKVVTYNDGTQVIEDSAQNILGTVIGAPIIKNINTNPVNARTIAAQGGKVFGVQYYTDANGIQYAVGGITTGQVTDTLSGGIDVSSGTPRLLGRILGSEIEVTTGASRGGAVNNGFTPVVDRASGRVVQSLYNDQINLVLTKWSGTGGYDPGSPLDNLITPPNKQSDGSTVYVYKDGSIRTVLADGSETVQKGTNNQGLTEFTSKVPGQNIDSAAIAPLPGTIRLDSAGNPVARPSSGVYGPSNNPYNGKL